MMTSPRSLVALVVLCHAVGSPAHAQPSPPVARCGEPLLAAEPKDGDELSRAIREQYVKYEYRIPMRDGVRLYTEVYVPRDRSRRWPIMLTRTPYGVTYGVDVQPDVHAPRQAARFAPDPLLVKEGYIFAHQDVRGRMMSEGQFADVRPRAKGGVDEATDAYDTIDFLVKNVPGNSGAVGVWGISYAGFYAAQAAIEAHPALKAVSPQAPVTNWFLGDDFQHNGALFLADTVRFFNGFGRPRPALTRTAKWDFDWSGAGDAYEYFLGLGPRANIDARLFHGEVQFWNDLQAHPTYDAWWQARDPRPHYAVSHTAVLVVGGLLDAEDLWGAVATWRAFATQSPGADVRLVLGPWRHGGWARTEGDRHGDVSFAWKTSRFYAERIEAPFFQHALKGCPEPNAAKAYVFETGTNLFEPLPAWPPATRAVPVYFAANGALATAAPKSGADTWVSDPAKPVPYRSRPTLDNDGDYMSDDQRFAARRPDVVVHQTIPLDADLTLAGPVKVSLDVTTTGTDGDFIVKLVDVWPGDVPNPDPNPTGVQLAGYQQLVRGEVFRGRFRDGFDKPAAFVPGQRATVAFTLPDVSHTFRSGHRLMLQVQCTWFPLVELNPQTFVELATAKATDYRPATLTLDWARSQVTLPVRRGQLP